MDSLTVVELRRCLRDLFGLAMLPAVWRTAGDPQIVESLADAIFRTTDAEVVLVHVPEPNAPPHTALRVRDDGKQLPDAIRTALAPIIAEGSRTSRLDVLGTEMNVLQQEIEIAGEQGFLIVAASRPTFPTEVESALVRVAANQATVALQNGRYVAELDRAALAREQLVAKLSAASQSKDEFLAVLGHELRNPLAAIQAAHAQSLTDEGRHGRAQQIITQQLTTLMRLVDDLLEASRVTTGKLALEKKTLNLCDVAEKARAASEHAALERGHRFETKLFAEPLWVDGDAVRLEQVLVNIVANAIRYTPQGGRISMTASRSPDGDAVIRIEDDGTGIAPDLLPRIFEPFVQADTSLHRTNGGLGLGLALVKGVVELHGGSVTISSGGRGKGCTVVVTLPLVEAAAPHVEKVAVRSEVNRGAKLRVLLVDDNADLTEMLAMWLEATGHETASSNDGLAALELAYRFSPDVVFVDIGLPSIDGYEVARRLRARLERGVTLVAMSGYGQDEHRALARDAGFDDHLVKPVPRDRIASVLASVARTRASSSV